MSYFEMSLTALLIQVVAEAARFSVRWLRNKAKDYPDVPPTGPDASPPGQSTPTAPPTLPTDRL